MSTTSETIVFCVCDACESKAQVKDEDSYPLGWAFVEFNEDGFGGVEFSGDVCAACAEIIAGILQGGR